MRIAIVSDIHGNLAALEAVTADIKERRVDAVVNLGDSLSGPLLPKETVRFLMAQDWTHLAGNHERQLLTTPVHARGASDAYAHSQLSSVELEWIAHLPPAKPFNTDIFLCHGTPSRDNEYFLESVDPDGLRPAGRQEIETRLADNRYPVVLCGHTHMARSVRSANGQWIVNPGSVGLPAYDDTEPYYHLVENGSPDARYAIMESQGPGWIVHLLSIPYDHAAMAELARMHGRPDWEIALRTGYMQRNCSGR